MDDPRTVGGGVMYPFIFHKTDPDRWYVAIAASIDYVIYNSHWMSCSALGDRCLVPDVDLRKSLHRFSSEADAIAFVRDWWKERK